MCETENKKQEFFVYLLESSDSKCTYVGATVNLDKRIRQHNKEISGGAVATSKKVVKGEFWSYICYISGFPDWINALQFEWRFKQLGRQIKAKCAPLYKRMQSLHKLINLDKSTSKAILYSEWDLPLKIHFECKEAENIFNKL